MHRLLEVNQEEHMEFNKNNLKLTQELLEMNQALIGYKTAGSLEDNKTNRRKWSQISW